VFDRFGTQGLLPLLPKGTYSVFENRQTNLNLWVVISTLLKMKFTWRDYCISYIRLSRAKLVLTCIDSNATFYTLKHSLPQVQFVSIQNSIRGNASPIKDGDLWTMLKSSSHQPPHVDYVATFGTAHSNLFRQHIKCNTVEIGSTRNNAYPIRRQPRLQQPLQVGYISSYIEFPREAEPPYNFQSSVATYLGNREILIEDYFKADKTVVTRVAEICSLEKWELQIAGKRPPDSQFEPLFYEDACKGLPYRFVPRTVEDASYNFLDACNLIVTIDSTLGYEMIARGAKVLFISARAAILQDELRQYEFGFPGRYGSEGPFWTQSLDSDHLQQLMNSLINMPYEEWRQKSEFVRSDLMVFDPDNSSLRELIAGFAD
jgi:surface carbohydrate biosynthesis protein